MVAGQVVWRVGFAVVGLLRENEAVGYRLVRSDASCCRQVRVQLSIFFGSPSPIGVQLLPDVMLAKVFTAFSRRDRQSGSSIFFLGIVPDVYRIG